MDKIYMGPFSANDLFRLFAAANPVSPQEYEWQDKTGIRRISREEAVVRSLEDLAAITQLARERGPSLPPSTRAKRCHAIAAAANDLVVALGARESSTECPLDSLQIYNELRWRAEEFGKSAGGFSNHPPTNLTIGRVQIRDYHGDRQLRDDLDGIRHIRDWALESEERAHKFVGRRKGRPHLSERSRLATITGKKSGQITPALTRSQVWLAFGQISSAKS